MPRPRANSLAYAPALLIGALAAIARADEGYFSGTKGARAAGRAGAFSARADDLSATTTNPAGLARIGGTQLQLGNRLSYNSQEFVRAPTLDWGNVEDGVPPYVEFAAVHNQQPWQALEPMLGVASDLGLRDWAFALTIQAPAGIGRMKFPVDGGQRYMMVSRDARILNYTGSVAWKSGDVFGVGASVQWIDVPRLRYQLVIDGNRFPGEVNPVRSELDMLATIEGSDPFTLQAVVGAWYRPQPFLDLAFSVQFLPSEITTDSRLSIEPLNPNIDETVRLTRAGAPANDVRLKLPLPIVARAAIRYRQLRGAGLARDASPRREREVFDVELDVVYESWSRVRSFSLDGDGLVANLLGQRVDVGTIAIPKAWRDTLSVHIGGDFAAIPDWLTLRGGVFYATAVAPASHAHVDFVSGTQLGAALGVSIQLFGSELALAYEYVHQPSFSVGEGDARVYQEVPGSQCEAPYTDPDRCHPQYLGQPSPAVNAGSYRAHTHAVSVDLLHHF